MTTKRSTLFLCALCAAIAVANVQILFGQDQSVRVTDGVASSANETPTPRTTSEVGSTGAEGQEVASPVAAAPDSSERPSPRESVFSGYRYWMAPAASIDHWPWGDGKYLPIPSSAFKEWLQTTNRRAALQDYVDGLRFSGVVSTLRLSASFVGETLEGTGLLTSSAFSIHDEEDDESSFLATPPLQSFGLAIAFPKEDATDLANAPATYPDGGVYLPDADGEVRKFQWSQRGKRDASGALYYDFDFHSFLRVELVVATSKFDVLTASGGLVTPILAPDPNEFGVATGQDARFWRVSFHGTSKARVTIATEQTETAENSTRPLGFRQESSYRASLSGVDLTTRFEFDRAPSRLGEATLVLDPTLALLTLEWGSVSIRPISSTVADDGTTRVRLRVPANLANDASASLRATLFCPIWFGERRLPSARLEADSLLWRESLVRLTVSAPLTASSYQLDNAVQTRDANRARAEGASYATFKLFDSRGGVRLTLRRTSVAPPFDSATDCYFATNEVSAKTTLFFNFDGYDRNRVTLPIANGWDVDSVQTAQPDGAVWSRGVDAAGRPTIALSFKNPPVPSQSTRVTIAARYVAPFEEQTPVDRLCPIDLQNSLRGAHALSLRTDTSSQIRYTTRSGKPFVPSKTAPDFVFNESLLREATPLAPGGARLWLGDQTVGAYATLESARSNYSVEASCACVLDEDAFNETWRLHCVPASGTRVDRLVFFIVAPENERSSHGYTVASGLDWTWSTSTDPSRRFEASLLTPEETVALRAPENADAYEINLATSRSVPFDINVFCTAPATREIQVPLMFFPDAANQSVEVVVESNSSAVFKTRGEAVVESTVPASKSNDSWLFKKAFRYDPTALFGASVESESTPKEGDEASDASEDGEQNALAALATNGVTTPRLELVVLQRSRVDDGEGAATPLNSLCWFQNYDSYYQIDGTVQNHATFYLENRGRDSFRICMTIPWNGKDKHDADESYDDFMTPDPWRDEAYRQVDFFTGALDPTVEWIYVCHGPVYDSINGVWTDGRRTPWTLWKAPSAPGEPERYVVDVRLLVKRRYERVDIEFRDAFSRRLSGSRRVAPIQLECDAPTLSGVWNAIFPPQFQTRRSYFQQDDVNGGVVRRLSSFADAFFFSTRRRNEIEALGKRFASRLGDEFALRLAIGEARRDEARRAQKNEDAGKNEEKPTDSNEQNGGDANSTPATTVAKTERLAPALDTFRLDAPTWGDVLGSSTIISALFAPEASDTSDSDSGSVVGSAFGRLETVQRTPTFLVDRYALVSAGVSPSMALPTVEGKTPEERANRLLEVANLKILIVTPELALATTGDALVRQFGSEYITLCGSSICAPASRSVARKALDEILDPSVRRFVAPDDWRSLVEAANPWVVTKSGESDFDVARGWSFVAVPIGRASEGVYVVNRYVLLALEFFGFVAFVVSFWRRKSRSPRFLLGTIGVCLAIACPAQYEVAFLTRGVLYGALCLFVFRLFDTSPSKSTPRPPARNAAEDVDESYSTAGYVDFARMSPEELHYLQHGPTISPDRKGAVAFTTAAALLAVLLLLAGVAAFTRAAFGADPPSTTQTASAPSTANSSSSGVAVKNEPSKSDASPQTSRGSQEDATYQEPRRVFVPIDDNQAPTGDYYWIDSDFYEIVRSDLRDKPRERSWRIVDALYQGVVNYNSFSGTTSLFTLTATYTVVTESSNVTIALPAVQLASEGGARFDRQTVPFSYNEEGTEIIFDVQSEPGVHSFELSLVPPQFFETTSRLAIPILPVASARLDLDVSVDAPELDAPGAVGKIVRTPRRFVAELGPISQLVITKATPSERSENVEIDVEQYFLARPRATQTDVRALFRRQATGGKIQALEIDCDPAFSYSGYCRCDASEIESIDPPTPTNPSMRVVFKEPISGAFSLNVDFVARGFSGVGRVPFPKIAIRGARIVRNLFALSPDQGVACDASFASPELAAAFQSAWGTLETKTTAVFDLNALPDDATIGVRLERFAPTTTETTTCVFSPASVKVDFAVELEADSDVFRLQFDVPKPFVVDTVSVSDEQGALFAGMTQTLSDDGLALDFETALRGKNTIKISGRAKSPVDRDAPFPLLTVRNAAPTQRFVRVYCEPNVVLEWKNFPSEWTPLDREFFAKLGEEPEDARPVEVYDAGGVAPVDAEENAGSEQEGDAANDSSTSEPATAPQTPKPVVVARINAPVVSGLERLFLYPYGELSERRKGDDVWKAAYQLRFHVESGRLDQIYVAADNLFTVDPLPTTSIFVATETTAPSGVKALLFTPKRPLTSEDGELELFFTATFKNDPYGVCLPRFQTIPSSLYEDYSSVVRAAYLATLHGRTPIAWTIRNMRRENDPLLEYERARGELLNGLTPGARSMAVNGAMRTGTDADEQSGGEENDAPAAETVPTRLDAPFPAVVEQATRVGNVYFERFALEENASARLSSQNDGMTVELARYSFFVNEQREIFGAAVFMVKPGASESCVVVAPPGYHVLEARVNGARRLVERAPEDASARTEDELDGAAADDANVGFAGDLNTSEETRWLVELDGSPYVKRLEISFQASGKQARTKKTKRGERFDLDFLRLESVDVERVLWICAFEDFDSQNRESRWTVSQRSLILSDGDPATNVVSRDVTPARLNQSGGALRRVGLEDAAALLNAYASDYAQLSGSQSDDLERMRARWLAAWRDRVATTASFVVTRQNDASAAALQDSLPRAIVVVNNGEILAPDQVDANFPIPNWNVARIGEIESLKERVFESLQDESGTFQAQEGAGGASSQSLWTLQVASYAKILLGSTNERVVRIEIVAKPKAFDFLASPYAAAVFLLMATAALLQLLDKRRQNRRIRSFVHVLFMLVWTGCFFLFGWELVALIGALFVAIVPTLWSSWQSRRANLATKNGPAPSSELSGAVAPPSAETSSFIETEDESANQNADKNASENIVD